MATRREKEKAGRKRSSARDWAKQQDTGREATCLKVSEGVEFCKLEVGVHKFDFLPFIAGKNNPRADEGMEHFERSYESHFLQTPEGGRPYPCRRACFGGKRCAVCDWLSKHGGSADPELVKGMRAKSRHLWLINDVTKHTGKGTPVVKYKVLDTGHFNRGTGFGELMQDAINSLDEGVDSPFVLEGGYTATLTVKEQSFSGKKYNAVTRIDLRQHTYDYDEEVLSEAPCLDACIVDVGYDAVKKILEPESADDEPDETPPPKAKAKPAAKPSKDEDADDTEEKKAPKPKKGGGVFKVGDIVEHPEMGECEVKKVSADGTSLKLEDRKGKLYPGIDPDEVTKVETADADDDDDSDDEPEEKPAPKPKVGKPAKDVDEDEDDDNDDDDEDSDEDEEEDSDEEDD